MNEPTGAGFYKQVMLPVNLRCGANTTKKDRELKTMDANYYLEQLYQDMRLRAYSEHTQDVYGRAVRCFLNFSGKSVEALNEQDVRNYVLHLMGGSLSKGSINTYQAAIRFFFMKVPRGYRLLFAMTLSLLFGFMA